MKQLSLPLLSILAVELLSGTTPRRLGAQGLCDPMGPVGTCINVPSAGDTEVSGHVVGATTIDLQVGTKQFAKVKVKNGTFTVKNVSALTFGEQIIVTGGGGASLTVPGTCSQWAPDPCLDAPVAGKPVTGKAAKAASTVIVVGRGGLPKVSVNIGPFTADLHSLNEGDLVELVDAAGALAAGPLKAAAPGATSMNTCTAKTALPCISPVTADKTQISGFSTVSATNVDVTLNGNTTNSKPRINGDGSFKMDVTGLKAGDKLEVSETVGTATTKGDATVGAAPTPPPSGTTSSLYTLGLAGVNATGNSRSGSKMQYFASFDVQAPAPLLGRGICKRGEQGYPLAEQCWVWLNPRISSAPTAGSTALSSFSSPTSLTSGISTETVAQITQTFEFQTGFEYSFNKPYWGRQFGWRTNWARSTISAIVGGGSSTPISSVSNAAEFTLNNNLGAQFNQNPGLATTYPQLAAALCQNYGYNPTPACTPTATKFSTVAFLLPNRSRFYRDYFAGFRLRTYYFTGQCQKVKVQSSESSTNGCKIVNTYPGTFDLRFGQDEYTTGGYLRGVVMTLAGSYPLPGTSGTVRVFGATYLKLHKNQNAIALALVAPTTPVAITDPSVVIQPIKPDDQDYYRLGVGVDLIPLVAKWVTAASNSKSGSAGASQ